MAAGQRPAWLRAAWAFCPSHSALGTTANGTLHLHSSRLPWHLRIARSYNKAPGSSRGKNHCLAICARLQPRPVGAAS